MRVSAGQRKDDAEDDGGQRRIRSQDQNAAGAEQRIGQQRHDGRVEAVDARHARCHRIGDADGHQHRRQHQSGDDVMAQPRCLILAQRHQPRQPPYPRHFEWLFSRRNSEQKLRAVLEMHRVVMVPLAAPNEAVLLKNLDDLPGDAILVRILSGFRSTIAPVIRPRWTLMSIAMPWPCALGRAVRDGAAVVAFAC